MNNRYNELHNTLKTNIDSLINTLMVQVNKKPVPWEL